MKNYIEKLRKKIGHDKFIHPAARIIIENNDNQILFIKRKDNGHLGIPAGAMEENETIEACIMREVCEETGLKIISPVVIGISSNPYHETVQYVNGDVIQYFTIEFYCNRWEGDLNVADTAEIQEALFMDIKSSNLLPKNEQSAFESLAFYRKNKCIMLK